MSLTSLRFVHIDTLKILRSTFYSTLVFLALLTAKSHPSGRRTAQQLYRANCMCDEIKMKHISVKWCQEITSFISIELSLFVSLLTLGLLECINFLSFAKNVASMCGGDGPVVKAHGMRAHPQRGLGFKSNSLQLLVCFTPKKSTTSHPSCFTAPGIQASFGCQPSLSVGLSQLAEVGFEPTPLFQPCPQLTCV